MQLRTPEFPLLLFGEFFDDSVYEPAEDTFLLLDGLEAALSDKDDIPFLGLEIGCGSGAITTSLVKSFYDAKFIAVDINPRALECTRKCLQFNASNHVDSVELVQSDLHTAFGDKLNNKIDLLVFNPPYVPTSKQEIRPGISATWAGGDRGRVITDRFILTTLKDTLSPDGQAFIVAIDDNKIDELIDLAESINFSADIILTRRCGIEKLSIIRFKRKKS